MAGFDSFYARMAEIAARVPEAGKVAVQAGLNPIYEKSDVLVPRDTETLADSATMTPAVVEGTTIHAALVYGSDLTMTPWHGGTGYELFVNFGTEHSTYTIPPNPFLSRAVVESQNDVAPVMAAAFVGAMA